MSNDRKMIEFDVRKLKRFKLAYKIAVADGVDHFTFEGDDYLVDYARYAIEYLEERLK